jgi:hypothetical protein
MAEFLTEADCQPNINTVVIGLNPTRTRGLTSSQTESVH